MDGQADEHTNERTDDRSDAWAKGQKGGQFRTNVNIDKVKWIDGRTERQRD